MLSCLKEKANRTLTKNGAITPLTTASDCLDLFATIGALRGQDKEDIIKRFDRAWAENPGVAIRTMFFARDIRGGLGERRVFRVILRQMANDRLKSVIKNLWAVPEFGRFDDLLCLLETPAEQSVINFLHEQFTRDLAELENGGSVSLLGKWLPSINASKPDTVRQGKIIAKGFGLSEAEYRRSLVKLRKKIALIENNLRKRNYTFDYEKQPSKALYKYRRAFARNDNARYLEFLNRVSSGEAIMHTRTLMPYEIIRGVYNGACSTEESRKSLDVTWNALEDFTNGENAIVVADCSASMYYGDPIPAHVAQSLAIYFAERNTGAFHCHFITFSENPRLVEIKGSDLYEKVRYCDSFNEVANTNISKVFNLILESAVKNKLPQSELPSTIYVISDMEFDIAARGADVSNFEYAKSRFAEFGYVLPTLVYWNVNSTDDQQPVEMNEQGVILVSGASPRVFAMIKSGNLSPMGFMLDTLNNERYANIEP